MAKKFKVKQVEYKELKYQVNMNPMWFALPMYLLFKMTGIDWFIKQTYSLIKLDNG